MVCEWRVPRGAPLSGGYDPDKARVSWGRGSRVADFGRVAAKIEPKWSTRTLFSRARWGGQAGAPAPGSGAPGPVWQATPPAACDLRCRVQRFNAWARRVRRQAVSSPERQLGKETIFRGKRNRFAFSGPPARENHSLTSSLSTLFSQRLVAALLGTIYRNSSPVTPKNISLIIIYIK